MCFSINHVDIWTNTQVHKLGGQQHLYGVLFVCWGYSPYIIAFYPIKILKFPALIWMYIHSYRSQTINTYLLTYYMCDICHSSLKVTSLSNSVHKLAFVHSFIKVGQMVWHNLARITLLFHGPWYKTSKNAELT